MLRRHYTKRACRAPALALAFGVAGPLAARADAPALAPAPSEPPAALATRGSAAPALDGDVLSDPVWSQVAPLTSFWQIAPDEGAPASQPTEVRILFTDDTLYFGVVCRDSEPGGIVVNESRRDSELTDTDSFQIVLDTYRDLQSGFVFGTNPSGLEFDGQVTNEGQGGGFTLGSSLSGFNKNWDASWSVRTRTGDFGWSAEFAIPFATLRYDRAKAPVWGLNLQRNIRRRNEQAFWAPLPRQYDLYRVSRAGTLEGLEPPKQRNLKLSPYALGELTESPATGAPRDEDAEIGGELKWSVTPSLALDVTVNTDFAQVEVDEQQINLDRFNLFYPEKRPFFLENAGFFTLGTPGEVDLFFSRRIGIGPAGEVVPILAGARLSGKLAGLNVGLLNMQTRAAPGVPASNFTAARVSRELPNRSRVGALFVNRSGTGDDAPPGDHNQTYGADARWGIGRYGAIEGYVAKTSTPGLEGGDTAWNAQTSYDAPAWLLSATYTEVGENFNPEVGFLERSGYRKPEALVMLKHRPKDFLGLLEVRPHVSYTGYYKPDGFQESGFLHMDSHFEWKSGWEVHTGVNVTREGVIRSFEIYPGVFVPPGTYDNAEVQVVGITNQGAPLSLESRVTLGGFFGGNRASAVTELRGRLGDAFNAYLDYSWNDVSLPEGDFVTNLLKLRVSYSFTPRLYLQALVQWNDVTSNWSTNLRLGWLQTANTGLFVVYNENRDPTHGGVGLRDRSFTIKYSRMFDLLD
jgi:Domain of unknown function (DUF5916)